MSSPVDEIKERLSVDEVISDYIKLQKAGTSLQAKCPFHADSDPSLNVSPDKGVWHCFGCQAGGDHFEFVKQIEGVEFPEALRILAKKAGVELKAPNPQEETRKNRIFRLNELALTYFREALKRTEGGKAALKYLQDRGVSQEVIDKFGIGYAPYAWRGLTKFLRKQKFDDQNAAESGLVINKAMSQAQAISSHKDPVYDRFRARIMFPIFSSAGAVIGFSGRIFEQALPQKEKEKDYGKYINSPNTPVFNKSRALYGLSQSKVAIRTQDQVIFVEGQLDVVLSHQAGVENVVASSGTALTEEHLQTLQRFTKNLVLCFDSDNAGERAAREALKKAQGYNFSVKAVPLPHGKDPADIVEESVENWQGLVKNAQPAVQYFMDLAFQKHSPKELEGKKAITESIFEILMYIPSEMERDHWLKELASRLEEREDALRKELERFIQEERKYEKYRRPEKSSEAEDASPKEQQRDRRYHIEANLLSVLLRYPELGKEREQELEAVVLSTEVLNEVYQAFVKLQKKHNWQAEGWQKQLKKLDTTVNELLLRAEHYFPKQRLAERELRLCLDVMRENYKKQQIINKLTRHNVQ